MANFPLVSVVITTFNRPQQLASALTSVISQTYRPLEIIVVDDHSAVPAKLPRIIAETRQVSLKLIRNSRNLGLSQSRNIGWSGSQGKYVAFMDDDDTWLPDKLHRQVALISSNSALDVVSCAQLVVRKNGSSYINIPKIQGEIKPAIIDHDLSTISSSNLVTRSTLIKTAGFDPDMKNNIDHDFWMRLAVAGSRADFVSEPLVRSVEQTQPRLTSDFQARIAALKQYLDKWEPTLSQWLSPSGFQNYRRKYANRVLSALAFEQFKRGKFGLGFRCFSQFHLFNLESIRLMIELAGKCLAVAILRMVYQLFPVPQRFRLFDT